MTTAWIASDARRAAPRASGFSLLELLLAATILGVVLLVTAALFARAVRDVRTGALRSRAAVHAQNGLEGFAGAPRIEHRALGDGRWAEGPPEPSSPAGWLRRTSVRYYPLSAVDDGWLGAAEAVPTDDEIPGIGLRAVEISVSTGLGERPIAHLVRLEWIRR